MEDFEEKLNSILSSPEAMGQIMALANSLSGEGMSSGSTEETEDTAPPPEPPQTEEAPFSLFGGMDPALLQKAMTLFRTYNNGNNEKTALLRAMRPFVREERRAKLDKIIQVSRFSGILLAALEEFRGGSHV
ncbi:MAG: hypothetical protein MJ077_07610 [Oscillospiraceae bacterium]|nr:hypothetical protein [Oscillospiraceae bacterium]